MTAKQIDMTWAQLTEEEKALRVLREAQKKVFDANVGLAAADLRIFKSASINVADIMTLLAEADKRLRHEIAGL